MKYYLGVDLGGTNIAVGLVNENGEIVAKKSTKTLAQRGYEEIVADMARLCKELISENNIAEDDIVSAGIGAPGSIDKEKGRVIYANNLNFCDTPLADELKKHINKPVFIDNDANCAAWAEYMAGSSKGFSTSVMITLGTGVGSGVIIDGKLQGGFNFCGGELGHTVIDVNGPLCTCGRKGCFEVFSSATGLVNMTKEYAEKDKASKLWKYTKEGKFNGRSAFLAADEGDETAKAVVENYIKHLAVGVANIINIFQPEIFVIGGGVANEGDNLIKPLTKMVFSQTYTNPNIVPMCNIVKAKLGNDAGIIGAALLK
jgi:glucokinase